MVLKLKPSGIRYSKNSIKSKFSTGGRLGDTLDEICEGSLKVTVFRWIRVAHHNGNWVTTDNRRLWLFRQLERLGKCGEIPVEEIDSIDPRKLTTKNDGVSISIRGSPGGSCVHNADSHQSDSATPYFCQFADHQAPFYDSDRYDDFDDFGYDNSDDYCW